MGVTWHYKVTCDRLHGTNSKKQSLKENAFIYYQWDKNLITLKENEFTFKTYSSVEFFKKQKLQKRSKKEMRNQENNDKPINFSKECSDTQLLF